MKKLVFFLCCIVLLSLSLICFAEEKKNLYSEYRYFNTAGYWDETIEAEFTSSGNYTFIYENKKCSGKYSIVQSVFPNEKTLVLCNGVSVFQMGINELYVTDWQRARDVFPIIQGTFLDELLNKMPDGVSTRFQKQHAGKIIFSN